MLLVLPFAQRVLPNNRPKTGGSFDLLGGVLLGLSAGLFLFGITQGQVAGFGSLGSWLYVTALVVGFFTMFANLAALVLVPLLVIEASGFTPGQAGLVLTPGAVALALLSPLAGRLSDRAGVKLPLVVGLTLMALSMFFLSSVAGAAPLWIALGVLGVSSGFAFVQSPANNAAAGALPASDVGAGLGLFSGVFFLGGGAGTALMGALLAARQEGGAAAFNPLYTLGAAPFSDAFLALTFALLVALAAASRLRGSKIDVQP